MLANRILRTVSYAVQDAIKRYIRACCLIKAYRVSVECAIEKWRFLFFWWFQRLGTRKMLKIGNY